MKTVKYKKENDLFFIEFTYDPATVAQVRCLPPGRRWQPELRCWTCPASLDALHQLREWHFEFDESVLAWEREWFDPSKPTVKAIKSEDIENLKGKLYPFQEEGVGFLQEHGGRALLADEMGLGKTIQVLAWLQHIGNPALPAVVVCPASLKGNWEREVNQWTNLTPCVLSGTKAYIPDCFERRDIIYIINYDVISHWIELLNHVCSTVVLDECHYIKSAKTQRTKATRAFCRNKKHVIALSGTPIVNRPVEFFTALNILAPSTFPKYWHYAHRYCGAKHNGFGWDFTGATHTDELHKKLAGNIMLRRMKKEVLTELPDKQETVLPINLNGNYAFYQAALEEAFGEWSRKDGDSQLKDITVISKLRQVAMEAKFDSCCEWIDNFLNTGNKLVIFCIHHKTIDKLMERYKDRAISFDGRTAVQARQKIVQTFQEEDSIKLFVGNMQAAGVGITLTASSDVLFMELPWTPGELQQASDRCHRIGQKNSVNVYYAIGLKTLEEDMINILIDKKKVLDKVLDGKTTDPSLSIVKEVIDRIRKQCS